MEDNHYLEKLEESAKAREKKKRKEKEMKISGKNVFEIQKIIKEKGDKIE